MVSKTNKINALQSLFFWLPGTDAGGRWSRALILLVGMTLTVAEAGLFALPQDPERVKAEEAFQQQDYRKALEHYHNLLEMYSRDPMYHYYAGVCLVKLEEKPAEALEHLQKAQAGGMFKSVPEDVLFYQGRAAQMNGNFDLAVRSYRSFKSAVKNREFKAYGADVFMEQARNGESAAETVQEKPEEMDKPEPDPPIAGRDSIAADTSGREAAQQVAPPITVEEEQQERLAEEVADTQILELEAAYETALQKALDWQFRADSVRQQAEEKRRQLQQSDPAEREVLRRDILELEKLVFQYQRIADEQYSGVRKMELDLYEKQREAAAVAAESLQQNKPVTKEQIVQPEPEKPVVEEKPDSLPPPEPQTEIRKVPVLEEQPVYADFFVTEKVPVVDDRPVETLEGVREGLVYRIQIAVFRNPVKQGYFRGLAPVIADKEEERNLTWYYIGQFRQLEEAREALKKVQERGFKDAFVVALFNGQRQAFSRAELLEKEWGQNPLRTLYDTSWVEKEVPVNSPVDSILTQKPVNQLIELTLSYRVQVMEREEALEEDEVEDLRKLSTGKGFEILQTEKETFVYLIGKFLTFENASAYADLLFRNGMEEAKVVAYLGRKQIPLDLAKQLTEEY